MVEQSRSGAYVPTGMKTRRQVEATSQWAVSNKSSREKGSDACPDCVAELGIRRREAMQTVMRPIEGSREVSTTGEAVTAEPQSPVIAPRALQTGQSSSMLSAWVPWRRDASGHGLPPSQQPTPLANTVCPSPRLRDISNSSADDFGDLITSQDLGDGLDTVILERKGELESVIVNSRLGRPTIEVLQRLSRELLMISHQLAFTGNDSKALAVRTTHQRSAIFSTSALRRQADHSVSDLMGLIDNAIHNITPRHVEELTTLVNPFTTPYSRAPHAPRNLENAYWQVTPLIQFPDTEEFRQFAANPVTSNLDSVAEAVARLQPAVAKTSTPYSHTANRRTGMEIPLPLPPSTYSRAPPAPRHLEHVPIISAPLLQLPDDDEFRAFAAKPVISTVESIAAAVNKIQPSVAQAASPYSHTADRKTGMAEAATALPASLYSRAPQAPRNFQQARFVSMPALQLPDDDDFRRFAANPVMSSVDSIFEAARLVQPAVANLTSPYSHAADKRTEMAGLTTQVAKMVSRLPNTASGAQPGSQGQAEPRDSNGVQWYDTRSRESLQLMRSKMRMEQGDLMEKVRRKMSV
ncbi:hypothetical protein KC353_g13530 [Hortaea werneckii]|uniref:Uncharacterized protein n=1 Tax=Hortaea werneckii TaxID=91943 RepID=A0A3M7D828_HORWE|nr:hypothetical protein KC353_g13530 [Hortaea werneckii]RMY60370.1 hypothetical protein D0865_01576 [Hortaea werneckii]